MNEKDFPRNVNMTVIDFTQTFGCFTDREENKERQVRRFAPFFARKNVENFEMYMPDTSKMSDYLPLNFELLLRVETNLKLNLIYPDGRSLIAEREVEEDEVHFIKFEGTVTKYELTFSTIFKLLRELGKKPTL